MKLPEIRGEYNQLLTKAEQGTPERAAYLNVYYAMLNSTEKKKAIVKVRGMRNGATTPETRQIYQTALDTLEGGSNE